MPLIVNPHCASVQCPHSWWKGAHSLPTRCADISYAVPLYPLFTVQCSVFAHLCIPCLPFVEPLIQSLLTAIPLYSLPAHCLSSVFTACSLPIHCVHMPIHCIHCLLTAYLLYSLRYTCSMPTCLSIRLITAYVLPLTH